MTNEEPGTLNASAAALPPVTDREAFEAQLTALRVREKAHTREGDAIAAARRLLPMVEVDASLPLTMDNSYALMDLTVYGRQERWEDSPSGWPQQCSVRTDGGPPDWPPVPTGSGGRPIAQWPRLAAGRFDDLTAGR